MKILHSLMDGAFHGAIIRVLAATQLAGRVTGQLVYPGAELVVELLDPVRKRLTLRGQLIAPALHDSLRQSLIVIAVELAGRNVLDSAGDWFRVLLPDRVTSDWKRQFRSRYLVPYAEAQGFDADQRDRFAVRVGETCVQLLARIDEILPAEQVDDEIDLVSLLGSGDHRSATTTTLLAEIDRDAAQAMPEDVRAFFVHQDLLGRTVGYFFRERVRSDPRLRDTVTTLWQGLLSATPRSDTAWREPLEAVIDDPDDSDRLRQLTEAAIRQLRGAGLDRQRIEALQAAASEHTESLDGLRDCLDHWLTTVDARLDDLQQGVAELIDTQARLLVRLDALQERLRYLGLGSDIGPYDELHSYQPEVVGKLAEDAGDLLKTAGYWRSSVANLLGVLMSAAGGDDSEAEQLLDQALEAVRDDGERTRIQHNRFRLHLRRGPDGYPAALAALRQAAELDSRYAFWPVGVYEPENILGAGAMGLALQVRQPTLGQRCVLKTLWSGDPDSVRRFAEQAGAMARLSGHFTPRIISYDYVDRERQQRPYFIMEYLDEVVDGEAWLEHLGALGVDEGLRVGIRLVEILAAAHAHGICPHDVKPANLLLRREASGELRVWLIDFGLGPDVIAFQRRLARGPNASAGMSLLARHVLASLHYAAPEQLREDGRPDPRSDLYGLAVTLYRLLTNEPPYPISPVALPVSEGLHELLFQCLMVDPDRRPVDADEVGRRLQRLREPPPPPPPQQQRVPGSQPSPWLLLIGVGLLLVLGVGFIRFLLPESEEDRPRPRCVPNRPSQRYRTPRRIPRWRKPEIWRRSWNRKWYSSILVASRWAVRRPKPAETTTNVSMRSVSRKVFTSASTKSPSTSTIALPAPRTVTCPLMQSGAGATGR